MLKLEVIQANKLTRPEFIALRRLTLGQENGSMFDAIDDWQHDPTTKVIRLSDDTGRVLAWGMVHRYDRRGNKDFQLYVRASERKHGYGKIIYDRAVKVCGGRANMVCHPHDSASIAFFNKVHYIPQGLPPYSDR